MGATEMIKNLFKEQLDKGIILSFDELINHLDLYLYREDPREELNRWYQDIVTFKIIERFLPFDEIILHSENLVYSQSPKREQINISICPQDLDIMLSCLTIKTNSNWNTTDPFCSFSLNEDFGNFRITLIHSDLSSSHGHKVFIRNLKQIVYGMADFSVAPGDQNFIIESIKNKKNILVAGATGSGKTSFLSSCLACVDNDEHIIILEDTYEIQLPNPLATRLISSNENNRSLKDYMSYAMRMSPDRIILGELRSYEVEPFLLAMNTGHNGLMSSIHANSALDAINRVVMLFSLYGSSQQLNYSQIYDIVCKNIDYVVFMKDKKVVEIINILGNESETCFYEKVA